MGAGASTYLTGEAVHVVFDAAASGSAFSFFSDLLPLFFLPFEDALSAELRDLLLSALTVEALCDLNSQADSGISAIGDGASSLTRVDVDEPPKSTDEGLATPLT
jgi:hypothetical protein